MVSHALYERYIPSPDPADAFFLYPPEMRCKFYSFGMAGRHSVAVVHSTYQGLPPTVEKDLEFDFNVSVDSIQ